MAISKGAAALISLLLFPVGLVSLFFIEEDPELYEVCEECDGVQPDCPWCGGF
jgi:hypothetical protein